MQHGNERSSTITIVRHVGKIRPVIFVALFAVLGIALVYAIGAASPTAHFEAEKATRNGAILASDASASSGQYLQFGSGASVPGAGPNLPAPINPAGRDFAAILKSYPSGGTIVLPDGDYKVGDISGFKPTNFLVVVAQNPGKARVVRTATALGATDQLFSNSGNFIFVGVRFHDIDSVINGGSNIYYWYTQHSNPIDNHPTPTQTVCTPGQGPVGFEIKGSSSIHLYGVDAIGFGHDGIKTNTTSNLILKGTVIDKLSHKNLQQGRGNASCGWDGNDNYHTDSLQIYPGDMNNLIIENSFVG